MFTAEHFIWIGLCAVFVIGMCLVSRKKLLTLRRAGYIMTAICALSEVSKVMSNLLESAGGGMHLDPLCLPFHLCSLMLFAVLYITFGGDVNGALSVYDTNFFYLTRPPMEGLPFLNLERGWYVYFLRLLALGTSLVALFHLPFIISERRAAR